MSLTGKAKQNMLLKGRINGLKVIHTDAYELAVKNGFEGTLDEWLESLAATDEQIAAAVEAYMAENQVSGGLTDVEKTLILSLFRNATYTTGVSETIDLLESIWSGSGGPGDSGGETEPVTYVVTSALTNVESTNASAIVNDGESYTATITMEDGCENLVVTVTMGGVDITADVYDNGVITIPSVTGNVVIEASATKRVNLFNPETVTVSKFFNPNTGALGSHTYYSVSDYIPVTAGKSYRITTYTDQSWKDNGTTYNAFDAEKVYLSQIAQNLDTSVTPYLLSATYTPEADGYVRINYMTVHKDTVSMEEV